MRHSRKIRLRGVRKKKEALEIDITSLLDILVILLVFLIKSYNTSGIIVNIPEGIELPTSKAMSISEPGVLIQVSQEKIWVDDELIWEKDAQSGRVYDHGGRRIIPLFDKLSTLRERAKQIEKSAPNAKKFQGLVNLVVDKTVRYKKLKQLMYTSAAAGYRKYKFVVLGEEDF